MNFNNMTNEEWQDWHNTILADAEWENYVNHNLQIVRNYRTDALDRAPVFDLQRNAIDVAIERLSAAGNGIGSGDGQDEVDEGEPAPSVSAGVDEVPTANGNSSSNKDREL